MIGKTAWITYVPRWRLDRKLIGQAWGTGQPAGAQAVANYDEDTLTMAVEAVRSVVGDDSQSGGKPTSAAP